MYTQPSFPAGRKPLSLSVRVSALLVLAALLPLLVTVTIIELIARPILIAQASQEMAADARSHTQLIDNYFSERILEADSLSRLQPIQRYLAGDNGAAVSALESLRTGHGRGSYYEDWSLFDLQGNLRLYYPIAPQQHGQSYIPSQYMQPLISGKSAVISGVYYNPASNEAYIDIYVPVLISSNSFNLSVHIQPVGFLRSSFDLDYVWKTVNDEAGEYGSGSYATILDQNGVRIAYTSPSPDPLNPTNAPILFKAITPLSPASLKAIQSEGLYGLNPATAVAVQADDTLARMQQNASSPDTFQLTPVEHHEPFEAARSTTYTVPWTYYVFRPLSTVTTAADQQVFVAAIITFSILVLAALVGLGLGRRITVPILRSVEALRNSSESLKNLALEEQSAAKEQTWVVDSSQEGLNRVSYYTNATSVATHRMLEVGTYLSQNWRQLDERKAMQGLEEMVNAARYIEKAVARQDESNKSLATAIRVTSQVSDQLATGATAATDAASQLEQVVDELRRLVGK